MDRPLDTEPAVPPDLVLGLADLCRDIGELRNAWEIELAAAETAGMLASLPRAFAPHFMDALASSPHALVLLRAFSVVGMPGVAAAARAAVDRLRAGGAQDTAASRRLGTLALGATAWLADDGTMVEGAYVELVRPGRRTPQLAAMTFDHELEGAVKDLFVVPPKAAIARTVRLALEGQATTRDVPPEHVLERVVGGLRANARVGVGVSLTALCHLPLVLAAGAVGDADALLEPLLDLPGRGLRDDLDDERASRDEEQLLALRDELSAEIGERRPMHPLVAEAAFGLLDFLVAYEGVHPRLLTIDRLRAFLEGFAPRKLQTGPDPNAFVDAVRDVLLELGTLEVLGIGVAAGLIADLERRRAIAAAALADRRNFGVAKGVVAQMLADGVPLEEDAMRAYLATRFPGVAPHAAPKPRPPSTRGRGAAARKRKRRR